MNFRMLAGRLGSSLQHHTSRMVCEWLEAARFPCDPGKRVISFTFDDFPASAVTNGARILEERGVHGTFYAACGAMERESGDVARALLDRVVGSGHELGCHSYSHLDLVGAAPAVIAADLDRNARALRAVRPGPVAHFAFPFGRVDLEAKRHIRARFQTGRGIFPGINRSPLDLGLLRANKLYGSPRLLGRARQLVARLARSGGWLIFFTHDVSQAPTEFGCTPDQLAEIVDLALRSGSTVAPMGRALASLGFPPPAPTGAAPP